MKALVALLVTIIILLLLIIGLQIGIEPLAPPIVGPAPTIPAPPRQEPPIPSVCAHSSQIFNCVKYVKNYDADTITFDIPGVHPLIGQGISVRVRHIDTPEIRGRLPCEKEAAIRAKRLVEEILSRAEHIRLVNVGKDKYFRILADVEVDGRDLKAALLKARLAYIYEGGTKDKTNWCERLPAGD